MQTTFVDAVSRQAELMIHAAKRLDERGYLVSVSGLNPEGFGPRGIYRYFVGGFAEYAKVWARRNQREAVIVYIHPSKSSLPEVRDTGRVFDHTFTFSVQFATTRRYAPICAALELMSYALERDGNNPRKWVEPRFRVGTFEMRKGASTIVFRGNNKPAFETLLRILEMPDHRFLLRGGGFSVSKAGEYKLKSGDV